VPDGVQLARQLWKEIEALPRQESSSPYRIEYQAKGFETCERCGLEVNMGYTDLSNPAEKFRFQLPYISLHYLQHGSFLARGSAHISERIDPRTLACVLYSDGSMHLLPVDDDDDGDGLTSAEESHFNTRPDLADTDNDGCLDGAEVGRTLVAGVDSLPRTAQSDQPYRLDAQANGLEACDVCGELVNMGYATVFNPILGKSLSIPFIGLHAMQHAGFAFSGTVHDGRVDPIKLAALLHLDPATSTQIVQRDIPAEYDLWPCFPNPFNPSTRIGYSIPVVDGQLSVVRKVRLAVYDLFGREVAVLVDGKKEPGNHEVQFDGSGLPSGVYFCRMQAGSFVETRRLLLVR